MIVVVIGIANCGTTYLTKCLNDSGISMWERANPKAEDYAIQAIIEQDCDKLKRLRGYRKLRREPFGFKNPKIIFHLELFKKVFPDAKYICCVRDDKKQTEEAWKRNGTDLGVSFEDQMALIPDGCEIFYFNKDKKKQSEYFSKLLNREVDLHSRWKPRDLK